MAKKFGKFLLATAAIGSAVAAYYFLQKKDSENSIAEDEDYDDDFNEDLEDSVASSRNYVPLTPAGKEESEANEDSFTPLSETLTEEKSPEADSVEEFFDEEDSADDDSPITDN